MAITLLRFIFHRFLVGLLENQYYSFGINLLRYSQFPEHFKSFVEGFVAISPYELKSLPAAV